MTRINRATMLRAAGFAVIAVMAVVAGYMFLVHEAAYEKCMVGSVRVTYHGLYLNYTCRLLNGSVVDMCSYPDAPVPGNASLPVAGYSVGLGEARTAADRFIRRIGLGSLRPVSAGYMEARSRRDGSLLDMYWVIVYGSNETRLRVNVVVDAYGGAVAGYSIEAPPRIDPRRLVSRVNASSILLIGSGETGGDVWLRVSGIIDAMEMHRSIYGEPRLLGTISAMGVPRYAGEGEEPYVIEAQPWYMGRCVHGFQGVYIVIINNTIVGTAQPFFPIEKLVEPGAPVITAEEAAERAKNYLEAQGVARECIKNVATEKAYATIGTGIVEAYSVAITYRASTGEEYYATIIVAGSGRVLGIEDAGSTSYRELIGR